MDRFRLFHAEFAVYGAVMAVWWGVLHEPWPPSASAAVVAVASAGIAITALLGIVVPDREVLGLRLSGPADEEPSIPLLVLTALGILAALAGTLLGA